MKYKDLALIYEKITKNSQRLKKTYIIAEFLKKVPKEEIDAVILLLQGKIYPIWDQRKIGFAAKTAVKAIAKAKAVSIQKIEDLWKRYGDLGIATENLLKNNSGNTLAAFGIVSESSLSIAKVFKNLRQLAMFEGSQSVELKQNCIVDLLAQSDEIEGKYIIRTALEDLRVGVSDSTIRDSIIWAFFEKELELVYNPETNELIIDRERYQSYIDRVQHAYDMSNDFGKICKKIIEKGYKGLEEIKMDLGIPIKMMLAMKAADIKDGLEKAGTPAQIEIKYDGFRIQVHKNKSKITLFTRRFEDVTMQFPDVVNAIKENIKADKCILDGEIVGYDRKTKKYLPFQKISQRIKRKYNISEIAEEFPVELNIYDILFNEGKELLNIPLYKRKEIISNILKEEEKKIISAESILSDNEEDTHKFYEYALHIGHEGLMIKNREGIYKPGVRVGTWLKLKPTMDPLELVITAAEWGEGKRVNWFSSFTLSCKNSEGELFEIGKLGTGIKEKIDTGTSFEELTNLLEPLIISEKGKEARVKPKIVIEVSYQEIQKSSSYSSGFALRFPTLLKLRIDKSHEEISDLEYIEDLYYQQKK